MSFPTRRRVPVSRFKAQCLRLLDDVRTSRRELVVTKRGRPVAMVVPVPSYVPDLKGSGLWQGDLVEPLDEEWGVEKRSSSTRTPGSGGRRPTADSPHGRNRFDRVIAA